MYDEAIHALIDQQAGKITEAVAVRAGITNWPSRLVAWKNWLTDRVEAIDEKSEPGSVFGTAGGSVAEVKLRAGTTFAPRDIYVTTSSTDPRSLGGRVSEDAALLEGTLSISETSQVQARVFNGDVWSGLVKEWFFIE